MVLPDDYGPRISRAQESARYRADGGAQEPRPTHPTVIESPDLPLPGLPYGGDDFLSRKPQVNPLNVQGRGLGTNGRNLEFAPVSPLDPSCSAPQQPEQDIGGRCCRRSFQGGQIKGIASRLFRR